MLVLDFCLHKYMCATYGAHGGSPGIGVLDVVTTMGVHKQPELLTPKPSLQYPRIFLRASFKISAAPPMLFFLS